MSDSGISQGPELNLGVEKSRAEAIVRCTGRVTSDTASMLKTTVRPLISEFQRVLLDLTNVTFLDSSGLGTIVGLWVAAKKEKHELKITNANKRIIDLFLMSNLGSIFEGHHDYLGATPD